ncbi:MAG: YfiR family protein [Acidobacteria bacterium]|nr:YfiR family protein [Acidobacteriota bacterium]
MEASSRIAVAWTCVLTLSTPFLSGQQPGRQAEDRVKAAVVLQLARFVEWPSTPEPAASKEFQLCVLGKDRWIPLLKEATQGETIAGRAIAVRRLQRAQEASGCNLVVTGASAEEMPWHLLDRLPVLTVSEEAGFAEAGGMVGLTLQAGRVGFELNTAAAERSGLRFSSKLLRLARLVGNGGR